MATSKSFPCVSIFYAAMKLPDRVMNWSMTVTKKCIMKQDGRWSIGRLQLWKKGVGYEGGEHISPYIRWEWGERIVCHCIFGYRTYYRSWKCYHRLLRKRSIKTRDDAIWFVFKANWHRWPRSKYVCAVLEYRTIHSSGRNLLVFIPACDVQNFRIVYKKHEPI